MHSSTKAVLLCMLFHTLHERCLCCHAEVDTAHDASVFLDIFCVVQQGTQDTTPR